MLWRFRRELIFCLFLLAGFFLVRHGFPSLRARLGRQKAPENPVLLERVLKENADLRAMLGLKKRRAFSDWVPAEVVGLSPWVYPSAIRMETASPRDAAGMSIVSVRGYLVGRVTGREGAFHRGTTLFHQGTNVSVLVASTGELGILEGGTFPFVTVKFLPSDCKAKPGDTVQTSGLTQLYPTGIPVGRIVKLRRSYNALAMEAVVQPFFYHDDLENVVLVR